MSLLVTFDQLIKSVQDCQIDALHIAPEMVQLATRLANMSAHLQYCNKVKEFCAQPTTMDASASTSFSESESESIVNCVWKNDPAYDACVKDVKAQRDVTTGDQLDIVCSRGKNNQVASQVDPEG